MDVFPVILRQTLLRPPPKHLFGHDLEGFVDPEVREKHPGRDYFVHNSVKGSLSEVCVPRW